MKNDCLLITLVFQSFLNEPHRMIEHIDFKTMIYASILLCGSRFIEITITINGI